MRDEQYAERELPAYGEAAQPAIVARVRPELRKVDLGTALAALALLLSLAAVWRFPEFAGGEEAGRGWAITMAVCSLVLLGICGFQLLGWRRAQAVWQGRSTRPLKRLSAQSWAAHLASYAVLAVAVAAAVAGSAAAGWSATATTLLLLALILLLVAQVLAAVQYVRASGPPGTVPAHMRRLLDRDDRRSHRA